MSMYSESRLIRTGYELSKKEIDKLTPEEKEKRNKEMLDSRDEIRRLNKLENELSI